MCRTLVFAGRARFIRIRRLRVALKPTVGDLKTRDRQAITLASGARSKTRPAWQSLARPRFPGFWPSLPGKCGLVKPGKPGHGQVFLATLATKVRLSRPC